MTLQYSTSDSSIIGQDVMQISVLAVIVLYQMLVDESPSLRSLKAALNSITAQQLRLTIVIADNTPGRDSAEQFGSNVIYKTYADNPGLATPYNQAFERAASDGFDWVLTLDQDTHLPANYLLELIKYIHRYASDQEVGAIVPHVEDQGVPLSPFRFLCGAFPVVVRPGTDGMLGRHASAVNSASVLRVSAIKSCGGYDERFPLNNSDTALFERLNSLGLRVVVMGDVLVQHELAIMQRASRMTPQRYERLLRDEAACWDLYMGPLGRAERFLRLVGRLAKGYLRNSEEDVFQKLTLSEIQHRLCTRRRSRMRAFLSARRSDQDGNGLSVDSGL